MRVRYVLTALAVALATGVVCVGGLSRIAMSLLASRNPQAAGRTSDDGFEMGVVTFDGSMNLAVLGLFVGVAGWLVYLVARPLLFGPGWFRWFCLSIPPGVVVASLIVHPEGVDFTLLGPVWLTVGLFVLVPATYGPLMHLAMVRLGGTPPGEDLAVRAPAVAWTLRAFFAALSVLAFVGLVGDVQTLA
ncbi:hypothetical protein [Nocardioides zhouii]|uniref:Uncharacterized protein n=1 Tax=Nocardioides zhouii TaxID=1168729 RepID=A0A4Q2T5B1_9ACTN|nr:hypothetical protein [Nocardioides zhouii]RYC13812.1 hypothetical protein EUA94_04260 [Nocardioides zhouii]